MAKKIEVELPVIPAEVADAIEEYLSEFPKETLLRALFDKQRLGWTAKYESFNSIRPMTLVDAVINGYTVEQSPEDKVRNYYEGLLGRKRLNPHNEGAYHEISGVLHTLDLLGIKIEGVNANATE